MTERQNLEVTWRAIGTLQPYARNSRTHSDAQIEQLTRSITEFGWTNPLLIDSTGTILAGHGRYTAAVKLGLTEVPTIELAGLTDAQRRAYVIADNAFAEQAGWDNDLLRIELSELRDLGFDLALTGVQEQDLRSLLGPLRGLVDEDAAPPVPDAPFSSLGDIWLLGAHRVMCGDSENADQVSALFAGARPPLMVTDQPYGVDYDASWRGQQGGGHADLAVGRVLNDDRADWRRAFALFPGVIAYVWYGALHAPLVHAALESVKLQTRGQIVWVKQRPVFSRGHYHWQHEVAAVCERAEPMLPPTDDLGVEFAAYAVRKGRAGAWQGGRKQSSVWFIEHLKNDTGHSTQKPVECMRRPMLNNSKQGDGVYDPFLGSGTTVIAAETEGRVCYGMELDPRYVDVVVRRWQEFTGRTAVRERDGATLPDAA